MATYNRVTTSSMQVDVSFSNMCLITLKFQCCNVSYDDNKDLLFIKRYCKPSLSLIMVSKGTTVYQTSVLRMTYKIQSSRLANALRNDQ